MAQTSGKWYATQKKILYLEQRASMAGARVVLLELIRGVKAVGVTPLVICSSEGPFVEELRKIGVSVQIIDISTVLSLSPIRALINLISLWRIWRYARRNDVDLIHSNSFGAHLFGGITARLIGRPTVWHIREFPENVKHHSTSKRRFIKLLICTLQLMAIPFSDAILCVSQAVSDAYRRPEIVHKLLTIHDGVNAARLTARADPDRARVELGISPFTNIVSIIARLTPWKGHEWFLRSAVQIREAMPDTKFLVVGSQIEQSAEPDYEKKLKKLARELGLGDAVLFLGFRRDVPSLIALSDVVVSTSDKEPFSQVLLETGALGKPVVAANAGGSPEIIHDGYNGYLVPVNDVCALASKVITLLQDNALTATMGHHAHTKVTEKLTLRHMVDATLSVYEIMCDGRAGQ